MIKTEINLHTLTSELSFREISLDKLCQQIRLLPEDTQKALNDFETLKHILNLRNKYHTLLIILNTGLSKDNYINEIKDYHQVNSLKNGVTLTYDSKTSSLIYQDQANHFSKFDQYANAIETLATFLGNYIVTGQLKTYYKCPINFTNAHDLLYPIINNISK